YDRFQNRFTLNALAAVLDKPYDPAKFSAGFHTELLVGQDATVIQSNGLFAGAATPIPIDVPHLYVTLNVPTASGNGLQFKVGRMVTLMGVEVIERSEERRVGKECRTGWSAGPSVRRSCG